MTEQEREQQAAPAGETVEGGTLLDSILEGTKHKPAEEGYSQAKNALGKLIGHLLASGTAATKVNQAIANEMIAELDQRMSQQLDQILHHPDFQKMESSWRGLKYMIDTTNFRENIKVEMLNVSKDDLLTDFEDSPEVMKSGLYKHVYSSSYGVF